MKFEGQTFERIDIELDGNEYKSCRFVECVFVYSGGMPPSMIDNTMESPRFVFEGAAARTLLFLTTMYSGELKQIVESWFEQIRRGSSPDPEEWGDIIR